MAIRAQHAGKDVWNKLHKEVESILQTLKWSGTASVTLDQHMGKHRQAYITLTKCAEHIPVDVPNKQSCVTQFLMELITSVNPTVLAVLAAVCQDEQDKRINFENAFVYLVLIYPIKAKLAKKGKVTFKAGILGAEASTASGLGGNTKKPGFGMTGVGLQYHKHKDFVKIPKAQKDELTTWQKGNADKNNNGKHPPTGKKTSQASNKKKFKSMISALETKQNEVLEAMADAHQAGIFAILGNTSPFVAQIAGAAVPSHSKDVLLERAQVASLKLQGILKARKRPEGHAILIMVSHYMMRTMHLFCQYALPCTWHKLGAQAWDITMA
jgi:hypothetical protein